MATVQTLDNIRLSLEKHLGKRIILKANKGRKQIMTRRGILENVYPSVFIVKLEASGNAYQRVSYSYSDLLTENVKLQVFKKVLYEYNIASFSSIDFNSKFIGSISKIFKYSPFLFSIIPLFIFFIGNQLFIDFLIFTLRLPI